jgi:hypothetical protein
VLVNHVGLRLLSVAMALFLSACSGGGASSSPVVPPGAARASFAPQSSAHGPGRTGSFVTIGAPPDSNPCLMNPS